MLEIFSTTELLEFKKAIEDAVSNLELKLMFFPLDESDEDYKFLLKKGVSYREQLKQINQELKNRINP